MDHIINFDITTMPTRHAHCEICNHFRFIDRDSEGACEPQGYCGREVELLPAQHDGTCQHWELSKFMAIVHVSPVTDQKFCPF